jgi:hypothetical protein
MSSLDDQLTVTLAERVLDRIRARGPGHCLLIPHVPAGLADHACRLVQKNVVDGDAAYVVVAEPKREWQARPAKVVELRNKAEETGGRLIVFVPAGQHLAAEDSFGRSTFEVLDVSDLHTDVTERLRRQLQALAPDLVERAEDVIAVVRRDERFGIDDRAVAAYLASTLERPSEEGMGAALSELGLLPDVELATADSSDVPTRLMRNLQQMETLTDLAPPIDRIHRLTLPHDAPATERLTNDLVEALSDGVTDRRELGRRLAASTSSPDFSSLISDVGERAHIDELTILNLSGDFQAGSEPPTLTRKSSTVKVRYRCRPAAASVVALKELRLELLSVTDQGQETSPTGVEAVKRSKSLPKGTDGTWSIKLDLEELDAGLYELRLRAFDEDNLLLEQVSSERFTVREEIEPVLEEPQTVPSVPAARVDARVRNLDLVPAGPPILSAAEPSGATDAKQPLSLVIKFNGVPGRSQVEISRALALVERYTLEDPRSLAKYRLDLDAVEVDNVVVPEALDEIPEAFLEARSALFEEIIRTQYPVEGTTVGPLVSLCDLSALESQLQAYVEQWRKALDGATSRAVLEALICLDQITFTEGHLASGVLIGPTHPLRLAWLARYEQFLAAWALGERPIEQEAHELRNLLGTLAPAHLPHVIATAEHGELRYVEPVDLYWGIWAPPNAPDVGALASSIRAKLRLPAVTVGSIDVDDVVQRIRRYLASHPYVDLIHLNFVQAGPADIVLRTLTTLQSDPATSDLRYVVRLFATDLSRSELGRALDEFMSDSDSPRGTHRDAADAFLSSTDDPLTPKLTYSKHASAELLRDPERYPAHMTFFLDWFELDAVPVPPLSDRRSFFANGLIVDPVVVYRAGTGDFNPQWDEHVSTPADADDWMICGFAACEAATARFLEDGAEGTVPAVRLELDRVRRSILDAVHRTSDWVVVIDPVFADEYLDAPAEPHQGPRYLIDSRDPGALETTRRIMVSTRSRTELVNLLRPIVDRYDLDIPDARIETLLDALHSLSPGLALRLLNNRTQALEAMSLALAAIYLNAAGVLRRALVIPLDLHQDFFREDPISGRTSTEIPDLRRTDLAVVQLQPERRRLAVNLVEVKARGQLPEAIPAELLEQIGAQLQNSKDVLRRRLFSVDVRGSAGSLAASLRVRRLTRLLSRYLERAARYGFIDAAAIGPARTFIATLDHTYSLVFAEHALVFDLEGQSQDPSSERGFTVHRVGRDEILDLLARTPTPVGTQLPAGDTEVLRTVLLAPPDEAAQEVPTIVEPTKDLVIAAGAELPPELGEGAPATVGTEITGPDLVDVLILGVTPDSRQFGVVGRVTGSGKDVAFDVDGTNVVSVFGVQGSGKSYTVGDLIEAALIPGPDLNRLPHPLAGVVFHYSTDQTYVSEFGSMAVPNDAEEPVRRLSEDYGAVPCAVPEVVVLVPRDLVGERAADFPGMEVHPLVLAPDELSINDWRLLMGVEGGEQLYVKAMSNVFRSLRGSLTVKALRKAIDSSRLTPAQKDLAQTRIEFVENFVSDGAGVARYVRPGRLLLVDVRDPWLEEENALALFMVLLRLASQATGANGELFNKVIVFDEAHKYMDNTRLTKAMVETVREMRHKGTTVVLASQNPPSVPREVIELSSVVIAHKFTSPQWLEHIRKVNAAFGKDLTPARLATLRPGEAFVWSSGGAEEFRRPQRVTMRPRLSRHGGATRRAGG